MISIALALLVAQAGATAPTQQSIRQEVCALPTPAQHATPDYASDSPDEIVIVAIRIQHNSSGANLFVNCTPYKVESIKVRPNDGRSSKRVDEIWDPTHTVLLNGDTKPYEVLDFKHQYLFAGDKPDATIIPKATSTACSYIASVTFRDGTQTRKLEQALNICNVFMFTMKNITQEQSPADATPTAAAPAVAAPIVTASAAPTSGK